MIGANLENLSFKLIPVEPRMTSLGIDEREVIVNKMQFKCLIPNLSAHSRQSIPCLVQTAIDVSNPFGGNFKFYHLPFV